MNGTRISQSERTLGRGSTVKELHVFGGGKGGAGASVCALYAIEELRSRDIDVEVIDGDEINQTLSRYPGLQARALSLMDAADNRIDCRPYDTVLQRILDDVPRVTVVDNGGHAHMPFLKYVELSDIPRLLRDHGCRSVVHLVVARTGVADPLLHRGIGDVCRAFGSDVEIVLWQNGYFGPVEIDPYLAVLRKHGVTDPQVIRVLEPKGQRRRTVERVLSCSMTLREAKASRAFDPLFRDRVASLLSEISDSLREFVESRMSGSQHRR